MMRLNARLIGALFGQRTVLLDVTNIAEVMQFVGRFVDRVGDAEPHGQRQIADQNCREEQVRTPGPSKNVSP